MQLLYIVFKSSALRPEKQESEDTFRGNNGDWVVVDSFRLDHLVVVVVNGAIKTTWCWVRIGRGTCSKFAFDPPMPRIILIMERPFPMPYIVLALIDKQILNHNVLHWVGLVPPYDYSTPKYAKVITGSLYGNGWKCIMSGIWRTKGSIECQGTETKRLGIVEQIVRSPDAVNTKIPMIQVEERKGYIMRPQLTARRNQWMKNLDIS